MSEELKFSSPILKSETGTSLVSRAYRQIIVAAAVFGLAVNYIAEVNKLDKCKSDRSTDLWVGCFCLSNKRGICINGAE